MRMVEFHFLRPGWWWALLPVIGFFWHVRQLPGLQAWREVCDEHLLSYLIQKQVSGSSIRSLLPLFLCAFFLVLSLTGPTWTRLPVPLYKTIQPRVLVLDMSQSMAAADISPDRLGRAKFKLHDLFKSHDAGQWGLIVYSGEPFIVSPLTEDAQTIDALLPSLTLDIMPVAGNRLDLALDEARNMIRDAGFQQGQILVFTGELPSVSALSTAKKIRQDGIRTSIMPMVKEIQSSQFEQLAQQGQGQLLQFRDTTEDVNEWLSSTHMAQKVSQTTQEDIPLWRDEGRWFLIPALCFLLPAFRRRKET